MKWNLLVSYYLLKWWFTSDSASFLYCFRMEKRIIFSHFFSSFLLFTLKALPNESNLIPESLLSIDSARGINANIVTESQQWATNNKYYGLELCEHTFCCSYRSLHRHNCKIGKFKNFPSWNCSWTDSLWNIISRENIPLLLFFFIKKMKVQDFRCFAVLNSADLVIVCHRY